MHRQDQRFDQRERLQTELGREPPSVGKLGSIEQPDWIPIVFPESQPIRENVMYLGIGGIILLIIILYLLFR